MDREAFLSTLADEGFSQVVTVEREPHARMESHSHPFEAKALIVSGRIGIRTGQGERLYEAGEVFHLAANEPHDEWYGPDGVVYLVGRR